MRPSAIVSSAVLALLAIAGPATSQRWPAAWSARSEPFRIIENVYSVGSQGIAVYLIATPAGNILIDGGLPEVGPQIVDNIAKLGFDPKKTRYLLNTHAHFDHSGGLAYLKKATGATMVSSLGDKPSLENGHYLGAEHESQYDAPPVKVDRTVKDGETLKLGGVTLTANLTPGHTRGCTSWTMPITHQGKRHKIVFFCSATVAANRLAPRPQYPGIVDDYRATFAKVKTIDADIYLAPHAEFFDMAGKRAKLQADPRGPNPFIVPGEFHKSVAGMAADFEVQLAAQQKAGAK